jgi:hypothetical protein
MNKLLQRLKLLKEFLGIWIILYNAVPLFIAVAGMLSGFPVEGIMAALFIAVVVTLWGYYIRIIRKKDDEIASLRNQIDLAKTLEQKSSQDVCGTYKVEGKNQIEKKEYSGVLQIAEHGELLSCTWEFGTTREGDAPEPINGTGLLVGNALAFTSNYTNKKKGTIRPGVALYKIRDNHMSGKWGVVEESNAGFEECWKKRT